MSDFPTGDVPGDADSPADTPAPVDAAPDHAVRDEPPGFDSLGLRDELVRALSDVGYESPSPIQAATIPALLAGRDVVGLAQTGTGKTAAFALPVLSRIDLGTKRTQALVLAPTRELALQVCEAFQAYAAHLDGLNVVPVYGGQGYGPQLAALRRGAHVVVGTPGRVIDHLERGTLDVSGIDHLVLDEADEMLNMGFAEDVERILADTPDSRQVALFSATMPPAIRRLASQYLHDPQEVRVEARTMTGSNTTQRYLQVAWRDKLDALTRILEVETFDGMIVFVRTKQATEEVAERLRARGFRAAAINGDLPQQQRERTVESLRSGSLDLLVATDVAARGLDVDRITHVVNMDMPHDPESYVHRIGRTGRAGRTGTALLFVTPRERRLLSAIERTTRQPIDEMSLPSVDDVNEVRVQRFLASITSHLGDSELSFFRGLVERYVHEHDVPAVDVAAALAAATQDGPFLMQPPVRAPREERPPKVAGSRRPPAAGMTTYRISVGRRHKINPGQIVGALANEGSLSGKQVGRIDIRVDHSLVELPSDLSRDSLDALSRTRISGQLIELQPDRGPGGHSGQSGPRGDQGRDARRGGKPFKKHKPRDARY